jgi:hypothetical protein
MVMPTYKDLTTSKGYNVSQNLNLPFGLPTIIISYMTPKPQQKQQENAFATVRSIVAIGAMVTWAFVGARKLNSWQEQLAFNGVGLAAALATGYQLGSRNR